MLKPILETRYQILKDEVVKRLRGSGVVNAADDDLLVFLKIIAIGLQNISPAKVSSESPWEIQFNQLRAFRPLRNAASRVDDLYRSFDQSAFHFNKGFMRQETIWTGVAGCAG